MVSVTDGEAGFNPRGSRVTTDFADRLGSSVSNVRDCLFYFLRRIVKRGRKNT